MVCNPGSQNNSDFQGGCKAFKGAWPLKHRVQFLFYAIQILSVVLRTSGMEHFILTKLNPSLHPAAILVLAILLIGLHCLQAVLICLVGPDQSFQEHVRKQTAWMVNHMPVLKT